jgi:hypothetical protein
MLEHIIPKDYPDFKEHGAPPCSESFPDAFFTEEKSESSVLRNGKITIKTWARYDYEKEAKAICAECPYKARCLKFAIDNHEQGIWGGTTERQRNILRKSYQSEPTRRSRPKVQ